ncbi:CVNH domain-containing protein [Mycena galopus ATCC 62051]|nr:CVNH domain-containing protein [Mycena galopus ATCC 62051]
MTALLSSVFLILWATAAAPGALVSAFNVSTGCSDDTININTMTLTLSATCLNSDGRNTSSTIPLDSCIGNDNGQLTIGTNFSQSCENIRSESSSDGLVISADCATLAGTLDSTSINVDVAFADDNGVLSCA